METQSSPHKSEIARKLIHYGNEGLPKVRAINHEPVAMLVCHGMGQQVRYETISALAEALLTEARKRGANVSPVEVRLSEANDDFLARAEVEWELDGHTHEVHIYEAYWAPLTEGKVTYWETIKFLLRAGLAGLYHCRPFWPGSFQRWMFGGPKRMKIGSVTWVGLLIVLLVVLLQVAIIAYVSLTLAAQWKLGLSQALPTLDSGLSPWLHWCLTFVPGTVAGASLWSRISGLVLLWWLLIAEAFVARYFIIEFVGDVAAYISPFKDSKFDELRHQIRKIGLNVGNVIYGVGAQPAGVPNYSRVVVVGHSLGSVLAYDTLNSLINEDQICSEDRRRGVLSRTRALITFGSPLDKTAFMFRLQAKAEQEWIREKLAASMQPLIVNYDYRPENFRWINIWSPMDIISGSLDYYDDPDGSPRAEQKVQNVIDWAAWIPLIAHVQYWQNETLRKTLYQFVASIDQESKLAATSGSIP